MPKDREECQDNGKDGTPSTTKEFSQPTQVSIRSADTTQSPGSGLARREDGNTFWQDSEKLEIQQLMDYDAFEDSGKDAPVPEGYKVIPCHMVYALSLIHI